MKSRPGELIYDLHALAQLLDTPAYVAEVIAALDDERWVLGPNGDLSRVKGWVTRTSRFEGLDVVVQLRLRPLVDVLRATISDIDREVAGDIFKMLCRALVDRFPGDIKNEQRGGSLVAFWSSHWLALEVTVTGGGDQRQCTLTIKPVPPPDISDMFIKP